jgi:glycosyltransferase involved in cell wall biosynthesis
MSDSGASETITMPESLSPLIAALNEANDSTAPPPELTILVPALNEELTVEAFLDWCNQGIQRSGVRAEILIIDSSNDRTEELAAAKGARVVKAHRRGLGRAYQEGIPQVRGKYVLMGDADCTYDFRELEPFLEKLRNGYEFVMGSRFRGYIEPGSMPALHRYFGTPVTTWILNLLYGTHFSDIHCGMRAITREALIRMQLASESWQYASEMVLKSVHMKLRTAEVPVRFLKEPEGRLSHHKRAGWLSPWKAGWENLEVMLTHGAEFFTIRPGILLTVCGLLLTLPATLGPVRIGPVTFSLYWMLLGLTFTVLGAQTAYLGCLTQILHDYTGEASRRWLSVFRYNRSVLCSMGLFLSGVALISPLLIEYWTKGLTLPGDVGRNNHMAITGLMLVVLAFTNFVFTLVLHAAALGQQRRHAGCGS